MTNSQLRERVVLCRVTPPVVWSVPIERAAHQLRPVEPDSKLTQAARAIGIYLGESCYEMGNPKFSQVIDFQLIK